MSDTGPSPAPPEPAGDLESVSSLWPAVVELVRAGNGLLGALLAEAQPVAAEGDELTVAFASSAQFLKRKAEDPGHRAAVTEAVREVAGGRWRVSYVLREELDVHPHQEPQGYSEEEWVRRFMEEFDAEELPGEWVPAQGEQSGVEAVTSEDKGA